MWKNGANAACSPASLFVVIAFALTRVAFRRLSRSRASSRRRVAVTPSVTAPSPNRRRSRGPFLCRARQNGPRAHAIPRRRWGAWGDSLTNNDSSAAAIHASPWLNRLRFIHHHSPSLAPRRGFHRATSWHAFDRRRSKCHAIARSSARKMSRFDVASSREWPMESPSCEASECECECECEGECECEWRPVVVVVVVVVVARRHRSR